MKELGAAATGEPDGASAADAVLVDGYRVGGRAQGSQTHESWAALGRLLLSAVPPEWVTLLAAGADASTAPIAENILRALASIGSHRPVLAMSGEWFVERGEICLRTGQRGQQGLPLIEMDSDLPERPQSASPAPNRAWRGPKLRALRSSRDFEEYRSFYEERELQHNHPSQYAGGILPELVHPRATRHLRVIR